MPVAAITWIHHCSRKAVRQKPCKTIFCGMEWGVAISAVSESECCVRDITSESESSPQSPSQKKNWVRITNLVVHILKKKISSKTWKQDNKMYRICQSKQRNTARPLLLRLGRDSGPSHDFWVWVRVRLKVKKNWTRVRVRVK